MNKSILSFVDDLYEDLELWYPKLRLEEAGYTTPLAGLDLKFFRGKNGYPAPAEALISEVKSADFLGLLVPGGFMRDKLRSEAKLLAVTRAFFEQAKLVARIC